MPVPAVSVAPLAVLVLAWDETTPAVRTLLAAVQAEASPIDSILMLVPQAEAPTSLSAEEYLPLPPAATTELTAQPTEPATTEGIAPASEKSANELAAAAELPASPPLVSAGLPATEVVLAPAEPTASSPTAPAWAVVRVLRLSSFSLPELAQRAGQPLPAPAWLAAAEYPAAPYIGATAAASQPAPAAPLAEPDILTTLLATQPASAVASLPAAPPDAPTPTAAPAYLTTEPAALAPDPEADLRPIEADGLASFEATHANLLPADDSLILDELAPAAALVSPLPAPEQAGWPEALAALRHPTPLAAAPPTLIAGLPATEAAELAPLVRLASRAYSAPDLNFQIIQYARFAVPLALADQSFEAVYAPAWPTWLAAQELRQRTGRPLVLHVSALAAPADEPLDTAAGWAAELQRQALRHADLVLAETAALTQRLRRELGLLASAVRTIAATDAAAIAQALRTVQPRPKASPS